jgi:transcriptional regulator with XRE-family HTH domain
MEPDGSQIATEVAARLGVRIRRARFAARLTQRDLAEATGLSQATISRIELGHGERIPIETWVRVAAAIGLEWRVTFPTDAARTNHATQMRCHRMVADYAGEGGWLAWTLASTEDPATSQTILERVDRHEVAVIRVWDVIGNFEAAVAENQERLQRERTARGDWRVSGAVVITATGENRRRLTETGHPVARAFSLRGDDWLAALRRYRVPMPDELGMIWTDQRLERLRPLIPYVDFRRRKRTPPAA